MSSLKVNPYGLQARFMSQKYTLPAGVTLENFPRDAMSGATGAWAASGNMITGFIILPNGFTVTNISWFVGSTPQTLGTTPHYWVALYDGARNFLRQSTDQTAKALAANALITDPLSSPYTTTAEGLYYVAIMVNAGGGAGVMPTYGNKNVGANNYAAATPRLANQDNNAVYTNTAPGTITNSASTSNIPYIGVA